jgi:hypothetical protein
VHAKKKSPRAVIGIVLIVLGLSCNAVGIGLTTHPKKERDVGAGIFWMIFSVVALVGPGALLVTLARRETLRASRMAKIVALATASERVPLAVLAEDLDLRKDEARELLLDAIAQGLVMGRLDLEEGLFVSGSTRGGVHQVPMTCRNCGAKSNVIVSASSATTCPYCGFRLA